MGPLLDLLDQVPPYAAYALLTVAVFAESVLLIGVFVPTFTLMLTAGAMAQSGALELPVVIGLAATAVIAGDAMGHRIGLTVGTGLRRCALGRRIPAVAWQRVDVALGARGGQAVFVGRFIPVVRTLTPYLAGAAKLPYRSIAPYSVAAATIWASAEAVTGYLAADTLDSVVSVGGPLIAGIAVALVGGVWVGVRLYRRLSARSTRGFPSAPSDPNPPTVDACFASSSTGPKSPATLGT